MNSTFIVEYLMRPFSPRKDYMLSSEREGLPRLASLPTVSRKSNNNNDVSGKRRCLQPVECMDFKPLQADRVSAWEGIADVLIVGFGGAGACAAIEAADSGASVIIFDAASGAGWFHCAQLGRALYLGRYQRAAGGGLSGYR